MNPSVTSEASYQATKIAIATGVGYAEFEARFENAVPQAVCVLSTMAACRAAWEEVVTMTAEAAPHGFLIYLKAPVDRLMRIAGHKTRTCSYLIGNHVRAERMYRHCPAIMLHTPMRNVLWEDEAGQAMLSFEHPGAPFSCFDDPTIAAVGIEITERYADLLAHLQLPVPESLRTR